MELLLEIEAQAEKLAATAKALAATYRAVSLPKDSLPWTNSASGAPNEVNSLRHTMLALVNSLHTMLMGPTDFIQHLAYQVLFSSSMLLPTYTRMMTASFSKS